MTVRELVSLIQSRVQLYQGFDGEDGKRDYRDLNSPCWPGELPDDLKDMEVKLIFPYPDRVCIQVLDTEPKSSSEEVEQ